MSKKHLTRYRRVAVLLLAIILAPVLSATDASAKGKIKVVATSTDLKSITEFVGGDRVEVESLGKGYQDPHHIPAKPSYMLKLNKADMFVKVGLDLEMWSVPLMDGARNSKILPGAPGYVDASIGVEILEKPKTKVDRSMGDIHIFGNPHYWLDPLNGKVLADNILDALVEISPDDSDYFRANKEAFDKKIDEALVRWLAKMKPYAGTEIITYHQSWPNFAKRFYLSVVDYIEPKPGVPPSARHIASLIAKMKHRGIKIILMEPYFSSKIPKFVANKVGGKALVMAPSVGGEEGVKDYFDFFDHNIDKLIAAFQGVGVKPKVGAGE